MVLSLGIIGCSTAPKVKVVKTITKLKRDTVYVNPFKHVDLTDYKVANPMGYKMNANYYPSVARDFRQKFLILHYTALDTPKSLMVLSERQVSAHYLVNDRDDDQINHLVSENDRAWHAGVSFWKGRTNLNDSSIGIEIVNLGYKTVAGEKNYYEYPEYQIKKVAALAKDIVTRYAIDPTFVLGHSDIAPQRKDDPGPLFPWKYLYEKYDIGAWYDESTKKFFLSQYPYEQENDFDFIKSTQQELATYGYQITPTGDWSEANKNVLKAFQMHFRPENYDGILDAETWAILKSLNLKYRSKS